MSGRLPSGIFSLSAILVTWSVGVGLLPSAFGQPGALLPPHSDYGLDTEGDGLFNYLAVEVHVIVSEVGLYEVRGSGPCIGSISEVAGLQIGQHDVLLLFYGWRIQLCEEDGPYTVDLSLYEHESFGLVDAGRHVTAAYNRSDFGSGGAFVPPHHDYGLDTDGDGLFNYLVVDVNLFVEDAGVYDLRGNLGYYPNSLYADNTTSLEAGLNTASLRFEARGFSTNSLDGPYIVRMTLSQSGGLFFLFYQRGRHTTAAYNHTDFDLPATLTPPHADHGRDTDGDGLFDSLVVDVSLDVEAPGHFTIEGRLQLDDLVLEAWNGTQLQGGPQRVSLFFDGRFINALGLDGPYTVNLTLETYENETYTTGEYSHTDFQGPPAAFSPPHRDFGIDADGNGLFDHLVIEASIEVIKAGRYQIWGEVGPENPEASYGDFASVTADLKVGIETVPLQFSGIWISLSQADGPYEVTLSLYAFDYRDSDSHTTAGYSHRDFDGPGAALSPRHTDYGVDRDQDGRYDFLVVDVGLQVTRAGNYTVYGTLYGIDPSLNGTPYSSETIDVVFNETTLDVGFQVVPLWFYGERVAITELEGPYVMYIEVLQCEDDCFYVGREEYFTSPYVASDFQEPKSRTIRVPVAVTSPTMDGVYSAGEWRDASSIDLSRVVGNEVPGLLLVKSDDVFLYVAYDGTGDVTWDTGDRAAITFDTGNDQALEEGRDDEFVQGGAGGNQDHYVIDDRGYWKRENSPYDPNLPGHVGLASASGFGPSDHSATDHRIYEFSIPLALLRHSPGDAIGFFAGSQVWWYESGGLYDRSTDGVSSWPVGRPQIASLWEYGTLILADTRPSVSISSPSEAAIYATSEVLVRWIAGDIGSGLDHFNLSLDGGPPITLAANRTSYALHDITEGSHKVEVTAYDRAGHMRVASVNFMVDATPPTVSLISLMPGEIVTTSTVELAWNAEDATSGISYFEVILDGERQASLSETSYPLEDVPDGLHVVRILAVDEAGNSESASVPFRVDTFILSPTGPLGILPLIVVFAVPAGVFVLVLTRRRKDRRAQ